MSISVYTFIVSDFQQNARIVVDDETNRAMIIDHADVKLLFDKALAFQVDFIVPTHCHIDMQVVYKLLDLYDS